MKLFTSQKAQDISDRDPVQWISNTLIEGHSGLEGDADLANEIYIYCGESKERVFEFVDAIDALADDEKQTAKSWITEGKA